MTKYAFIRQFSKSLYYVLRLRSADVRHLCTMSQLHTERDHFFLTGLVTDRSANLDLSVY